MAVAKARVTTGLALANTSGWYRRRHRPHEVIQEYYAYMHDTGMVRAGPKHPFVNWDTVISMLRR